MADVHNHYTAASVCFCSYQWYVTRKTHN